MHGPHRLIGAASLVMLLLGACAERRESAGQAPAGVPAPGLDVRQAARVPGLGGDDSRATPVMIATWARPVPGPGVVGSALALARGRLALRNNCLLLEGEGGGTILPVFPGDRIQWDAPALTLTHEGERYRPGDPITIGGGGVGRDSPALAPIAALVARCAPDSVWFVGG